MSDYYESRHPAWLRVSSCVSRCYALQSFPLSYNCPPQSLKDMKKKYLIALPCFAGSKGFNHQTIIVSAKDEWDAISLVYHLRGQVNIGDIKEVE